MIAPTKLEMFNVIPVTSSDPRTLVSTVRAMITVRNGARQSPNAKSRMMATRRRPANRPPGVDADVVQALLDTQGPGDGSPERRLDLSEQAFRRDSKPRQRFGQDADVQLRPGDGDAVEDVLDARHAADQLRRGLRLFLK